VADYINTIRKQRLPLITPNEAAHISPEDLKQTRVVNVPESLSYAGIATLHLTKLYLLFACVCGNKRGDSILNSSQHLHRRQPRLERDGVTELRHGRPGFSRDEMAMTLVEAGQDGCWRGRSGCFPCE
jgi:hypothetical protein